MMLEAMAKGWRPYLCVTLFGFMLYLPTLFYGFTGLDDTRLIVNNQVFLKAGHIVSAFQHDVFMYPQGPDIYYRPILTLSFMLDFQLSGLKPFSYHLSNLVFHLIAVCLLFAWLVRLGYRREGAFLAALVFAVHPAITQAVAWIPGRNETLLAIFLLAALLTCDRFFFFALALFTKESAVLLTLFSLWLNRRKWLHFLPGWILVFASWAILRQMALVHPIRIDYLAIVTNIPAVLLYLGKAIFPFNLSVLPLWEDANLILGWLALLLLIVGLYFSRSKEKGRVWFGAAWFLLFLLPTFIRYETGLFDFAEHRLYLPLIGLLIVILEMDWLKNIRFGWKETALTAILIIVLAAGTLSHMRDYRNELTFWQSAARTAPSSLLAHANLSGVYARLGDLDAAIVENQKALELDNNSFVLRKHLEQLYKLKRRPRFLNTR